MEEATYREEPLIFFQNELILTALNQDGLPVATWSSIPELNELLGSALTFPVLKVVHRRRDKWRQRHRDTHRHRHTHLDTVRVLNSVHKR